MSDTDSNLSSIAESDIDISSNDGWESTDSENSAPAIPVVQETRSER